MKWQGTVFQKPKIFFKVEVFDTVMAFIAGLEHPLMILKDLG